MSNVLALHHVSVLMADTARACASIATCSVSRSTRRAPEGNALEFMEQGT